MPDILWPGTGRAFAMQDYNESLQYDVEITTARSGRVVTRGMPGARWGCTLVVPGDTAAHTIERRQLLALLARLRGGANRLLLWNLVQPLPLGSLRRSPVLASTAAAGASTITLSSAFGPRNLLPWSGFLDADLSPADGLADPLASYGHGASGALTYAIGANDDGVRYQRIVAASLGSTAGDLMGLVCDVPASPGVYTFAADMRTSPVLELGISLQALNAGGVGLAYAGDTQDAAVFPAVRRPSISLTAPAGTTALRLRVWGARNTVGGTPLLDMMRPQLEAGATATAYDGPATLLRGDQFQLGATGQRVMVAADAKANDSGVMTVQVEPSLRASVSSGTAVVYDKPTTAYIVTSPRVPMPARASDLPGFSIELIEAP